MGVTRFTSVVTQEQNFPEQEFDCAIRRLTLILHYGFSVASCCRKMSQPAINCQSHIFFIEPSKNKYLPPWFLEFATRDEAENVLSQSDGNILMRTHSNFNITRKYVITHRKEAASFRHYLLLNTPDGFLIDVDHKNNHPVHCLSEAMQLFVKLVGRAAKPISCGSSSDYLRPSSSTDLVKTNHTNVNENVPIGLGRSAERLLTCHNYINIPQAASSAVDELNRNIPSSPEKSDNCPIHEYLNAPWLSAASNRDPHNYVNVQQTSPTEEDAYSEKAGFRSQSRMDDVPPNFPPPSPKWN